MRESWKVWIKLVCCYLSPIDDWDVHGLVAQKVGGVGLCTSQVVKTYPNSRGLGYECGDNVIASC